MGKNEYGDVVVKVPGGILTAADTKGDYPGICIWLDDGKCREPLAYTEYDIVRKTLITSCYQLETDEPSIIFRHEDGEDLR